MEASESDELTPKFEGTTYYFCLTDCCDFFGEYLKRFVGELQSRLSETSGVTVPRLHYGRAGGEFDLTIADRSRWASAITSSSGRRSPTTTCGSLPRRQTIQTHST